MAFSSVGWVGARGHLECVFFRRTLPPFLVKRLPVSSGGKFVVLPCSAPKQSPPPRESGGGRCAEENEKLCIRVGVRGGIERNRKEGVETGEGGRVKRNGEGGGSFLPAKVSRERKGNAWVGTWKSERDAASGLRGGRGRGKQSRQGNPRRGRALKKGGGNKREGRLQAGGAADVVESFLFPFCIPLLSFVPSSAPPRCLAFEFRRNEWNRKRLGLEGERLVFQL